MPQSLENQFISDLYTSLLHLSGAELGANGPINQIFDGSGNSTGLSLSGDRVIVNNYIYPRGFEERDPLEWLDCFFPVGCLQLTFDDNNPTDRIAGTTWVQVAKGRFLVGTGVGIDKHGLPREFCPGGLEEEEAGLRGGSGDIAGEYEVGLTTNQLPAHTHEVDVGAVDIQVPNPAGGGTVCAVEPVGTVNSTVSFREQVQARYELGQELNLYPSSIYPGIPTIDMDTITEASMPWAWALDLLFLRGSARGWDTSTREKYEVGALAETYQFKEVVGLWNGETRYLADTRIKIFEELGNPAHFEHDEITFTRKTPYQAAIDLGAIDVGEADDGRFLTSDTDVPIVAGTTEVINTQEGQNSTVVSAAVGLDGKHNNILPSYGVYVWKRIS